MCGIVGYIGPWDTTPTLMEGLRRIEYRGYDSAGVTVVRAGALRMYKTKGKVRDLERLLPQSLKGTPGIDHTRSATHGEPSDRNAHPHTDAANRYAVVHTGIIENAQALQTQLLAQGVSFRAESDSEVLARLIASMSGETLEQTVRAALRMITGACGIAALDAEHPEALIVARRGSPVILGIGEREMIIASDVAAHPAADHAVAHLAARAGLSPRHFARLSHDEVRITPAAWVEAARVAAARRLLEGARHPPKQVAAQCGFANADTLRRAFRGRNPRSARSRPEAARDRGVLAHRLQRRCGARRSADATGAAADFRQPPSR